MKDQRSQRSSRRRNMATNCSPVAPEQVEQLAQPSHIFNKPTHHSTMSTSQQNYCLMRLYHADVELKAVSSELDSFDGKKDPIRCNLLVNQLRTAQDKVISLLFQLMDECYCERAPRDYRMKFPDEILLSEGSESLNGQIWFGAECLSAGSNILNHTKESTMLRPMAKTLTAHLDSLRNDLRDLVIEGHVVARINQALVKKMVQFDHIFTTFEYEYVRTMLPIRTVAEIEKLQEVAVLFSETLIDCLKRGLIKQDDLDEFQPTVMIAIPRLAIVRGLLYRNENPIYTRHKSQMCTLFQPFHGPLHSIRRLLRGLSPQELFSLERMLANDQTSSENPPTTSTPSVSNESPASPQHSTTDHQLCKFVETTEGRDNSACRCKDQSEASTSNSLSASNQHEFECSNNQNASNNLNCLESRVVIDLQESNQEPSSSNSIETSKSLSHPTQAGANLATSSRVDSSSSNELEEAKSKSCPNTSTERDRDDALIEELIVKQAQQLLHRLFVAISGVADQLQSNFASDLRFILRHIFSAELENDDDDNKQHHETDHIEEEHNDDDDDDESDHRDYSNEHSDSSLPIEQGIEAHEVANLIDLSSGYSPDTVYDYEPDMRFNMPPPPPNNFQYASTAHSELDHYLPGSSLYHSNSNNSNSMGVSTVQAFQDALVAGASERMISDMMRAANQQELIYDIASPNDLSIMDHTRHHQHLLQQHLQQHSPRISSRAPGRSHRHTDTSVSQHGAERRSRQGHGGFRSRIQRGPPVWVPDQLVVACSCCNAAFTLFRRRHHCRVCGQIFCAECSKFTKILNRWGYNGPVRVCESCFNLP